jgi:hypothetical protein
MIDYDKLQQVHKLYPMGQLKVIPIFDRRGNLETFNYSMEIEKVMADYFFSIDDLIKKLQPMIENYCNHKNIETGAYSRSNPPKKCDACGVLCYE